MICGIGLIFIWTIIFKNILKKLKYPTMKYIKIVLVIASILVGLFLIGFTIGKIKSPDYSKKILCGRLY